MYESRVKGRHVALANPIKESATKEKNKTKGKKRSEGIKRVEKALARGNDIKGGWRIEKAAERFDLFIPLHHLWMGYMSELLDLPAPPLTSASADVACKIPSSASMHAKLVKADLHGSILTGGCACFLHDAC